MFCILDCIVLAAVPEQASEQATLLASLLPLISLPMMSDPKTMSRKQRRWSQQAFYANATLKPRDSRCVCEAFVPSNRICTNVTIVVGAPWVFIAVLLPSTHATSTRKEWTNGISWSKGKISKQELRSMSVQSSLAELTLSKVTASPSSMNVPPTIGTSCAPFTHSCHRQAFWQTNLSIHASTYTPSRCVSTMQHRSWRK